LSLCESTEVTMGDGGEAAIDVIELLVELALAVWTIFQSFVHFFIFSTNMFIWLEFSIAR